MEIDYLTNILDLTALNGASPEHRSRVPRNVPASFSFRWLKWLTHANASKPLNHDQWHLFCISVVVCSVVAARPSRTASIGISG